MANLLHAYDMLPVRAKKANGKVTTIALTLMDYTALRVRYPKKQARGAAVNAASAEFDQVHPHQPRNHEMNRSRYIREKLLR